MTPPKWAEEFLDRVGERKVHRRCSLCSPLFKDHQLRTGVHASTRRRTRVGWRLNMGGIALMWRGGCIIRSAFLGDIKNAFDHHPNLENLLLDNFFSPTVNEYQDSWRRALVCAIENGIPSPTFSSALAFIDRYRTERLQANLLQAQRDFFGAHTYERVDKPRGEFFHTNWTGRGGRVTSSSYNA
jgi:6-phosphogluconate dehydrogenase